MIPITTVRGPLTATLQIDLISANAINPFQSRSAPKYEGYQTTAADNKADDNYLNDMISYNVVIRKTTRLQRR